MWTNHRRDRRTRRQARFQLDCLDDRLVLSAAGGVGAAIAHLGAVEQRLETRLARLEAQDGDHVTPAMSRIQTRLARIQARMNGSGAATSGGSSGPGFQMTTVSTGSNTGGSTSTTTGATTPSSGPPPGACRATSSRAPTGSRSLSSSDSPALTPKAPGVTPISPQLIQ
jgi:hypothetical protein